MIGVQFLNFGYNFMDTDNLRLFVLAAEKLNISAAGRALGMAPAAASTRLAKLEHQLGVELLHRSTRKVSVSLEGTEFLPFAREMLAQQDAGFAALGRGNPTVSGMLRFAASSTFAAEYIAPILPAFFDHYPGLKLDLRLSDTPFDLIEGSFDLTLRSAPLADSTLKARKLADDTRVLVAAPAYLERHGVPDHPGALKDHHLIGFRDAAPKPLRSPVTTDGIFDPGAADCRLIIDDGAGQKAATLAGAGISMNSLWSVHADLRDGTLVRVLPDHEIDDRSVLWLVYPKSNVLSAKVRAFIDFLVEHIGRNPPWLGSEQISPGHDYIV